jgi:hypothetical protein
VIDGQDIVARSLAKATADKIRALADEVEGTLAAFVADREKDTARIAELEGALRQECVKHCDEMLSLGPCTTTDCHIYQALHGGKAESA